MEKKFAVGIDIGGTNTKFGIVNRNGDIIEQDRLMTNAYDQVEDFIDAVHQLLMPMINRAGGVDAFLGIGMGAPNGNIYTGTIEYAPNLKWKGIIHIARLMQEKIGLPTKLTNDANAAAMGEMLFGCAKDCKHFITITLEPALAAAL